MKNDIKYQESNTRYYCLKIVIETGTRLFKRAKKMYVKNQKLLQILKNILKMNNLMSQEMSEQSMKC